MSLNGIALVSRWRCPLVWLLSHHQQLRVDETATLQRLTELAEAPGGQWWGKQWSEAPKRAETLANSMTRGSHGPSPGE